MCKESPEQWKNEWHKKKKKEEKEERRRGRRMPLSLQCYSSEAGLHKAKVASQHC